MAKVELMAVCKADRYRARPYRYVVAVSFVLITGFRSKAELGLGAEMSPHNPSKKSRRQEGGSGTGLTYYLRVA